MWEQQIEQKVWNVEQATFVKDGVDIGIFIDVFLYFRMRELTNERPVAILRTFQAT